jgi:hypothetical protein
MDPEPDDIDPGLRPCKKCGGSVTSEDGVAYGARWTDEALNVWDVRLFVHFECLREVAEVISS